MCIKTCESQLGPSVYTKFKRSEQFEEAAKNFCSTFCQQKLKPADEKRFLQILNDFNSAWTNLLLSQKTIAFPKKTDSVIQFHSHDKQFSWLSNFFKTIIYDEITNLCLPSLEHHYVYWKHACLDESVDLSELALLDPSGAKQAGSHLTVENDKDKIAVMERLVSLKFDQNRSLEEMLRSTNAAKLEEATSDLFWGTGRSEYGLNHLGAVLEGKRNQ